MLRFSTVDELLIGRGCFDRLGDVAAALGTRALIVTGTTAMRETGVTDRARGLLEAAGLGSVLFEQIEGEPTAEQVDAGRAACSDASCDLVVGLGGGSPVDAAKAIAALVYAEAPTSEYVRGRSADADRAVPCIAVPTTSGTGAEVTPNAVISDPAGAVKASIRGAGVLPRAALVDPDLTITCPPGVTAASGMDALTQAIESYVSIHATPLTEALSFRAAELLLDNLPPAHRDGSDTAARLACSYGSVMAGIALAHARLGVVHGMAHPLGVRYGIPHGICCAVLLPASIELNRGSAGGKYERLSNVVGRPIERACRDLLLELDLPEGLGEYGIPPDEFAMIAQESMPSGSLKANPKPIEEPDVVRILQEVTT